MTSCPACAGERLAPLLRIPQVPVLVTQLYPSAELAAGAESGELDLAVCEACGTVCNLAFDPSTVGYDGTYENSQLFSPTFRTYARSLARRLVATYQLAGRTVVEIGSGKGEFLALLVEEGIGHGVGFDPTYTGEVADHHLADRLTLVAEEFGSGSDVDAALICCRHVLEHLDDPAALLRDLRERLEGADTAVYFEVPNAGHVFTRSGIWDLIYQHVSYFTEAGLRALFERCGFDVLSCETPFDGQFLGIDARPSGATPPSAATSRSPGQPGIQGSEHEQLVETWRRWLGDDTGAEVVLWGAGAKGVTFLNLVDDQQRVAAVVDVNPRKVGSFVPGTGQRILAPAELRDRRVDKVIVANPAYQAEIEQDLRQLGIDAEVVSL